jgi:predicted metalloprotease with PDZ domain
MEELLSNIASEGIVRLATAPAQQSACTVSLTHTTEALHSTSHPATPFFAVAAHAGLKAGDVILTINGEPTTGHAKAICIINEATKAKDELTIDFVPSESLLAKTVSKPAARRSLQFKSMVEVVAHSIMPVV